MRYVRSLTCCAFLVMAPSLVTAQDDDGSFLERTIQNALSGAGREVSITGFAGALSSTATLEQLTIADTDGVWLTLTDAQLVWRRAALLRGRLELDSLTAASISLARLPRPDAPEEKDTGFQLPKLPPPEAVQFALPELPVSIRVGEISIARMTIAEPVIGQTVEASLSGSAVLADGEGDVDLQIDRTDEQQGSFVLAGAYANSTEILSLRLSVTEAQNGVVATLLNMPGEPSLDLSIAGEGPVSDFMADIGLRTDGADRLTGVVEVGSTTTDDRTEQFFNASLSGDITPLLQPDYRDFIGDDLSLEVAGVRSEQGGLDLSTLRLDAAALDIEGRVSLDADAWPRRIDLQGQIAPVEGDSVLLSIPGPPTRLAGADLSFAFDAEEGDGWLMSVSARDVTREEFALGSVLLGGQGVIQPGEGEPIGRASGQVSARIAGLDLGDAALTEAVGSALDARFDFAFEEDAPFELRHLSLAGADYGVVGDITVQIPEDSPSPRIGGRVTINATDTARFAAIAGQPIRGGIRLDVAGDAAPLDGAFDLELSGATDNLAVGIAELDPLIAGTGAVSLAARRDGTGTFVDRLSVRTPQADVSGTVSLSSGTTAGRILARIPDVSIVRPEMTGEVLADATFDQAGDVINADVSLRGPGGTRAEITARTPDGAERTTFEASIAAQDLSVYAWAVGQPIRGGIRLDVAGDAAPLDGAFDLELSGATDNLAVGIAELDPLIAGTGAVSLAARRDGTGTFVDRLSARTPQADVSGTVSLSSGTTAGRILARIPDVSIVRPEMTGEVLADATFDQAGDVINADVSLRGPGGTQAEITARTPDGAERTTFDASIAAQDLSVYAWAVGQPIAGSVDIRAEGDADISSGAVSARLNGSTTDLRVGVAEADTLLDGVMQVVLDAERDADGELTVNTLGLTAPRLNALASGDIGGTQSRIDYSVSIPDFGLILPDLPGEVASEGTITTDGDEFAVDSTLTGPGGLQAALAGRVQSDASQADLTLTGSAPLALANRRLAPNIIGGALQFDLGVNGPPELASVSGTVSTSGATMSLPGPGLAIRSIDGDVALSGGRAQVNMTVSPEPFGEVRITGPVSLTNPFPGDLAIALNNVGVARAGLVETSLDGQLTVSGPLTGGARIAGQIVFDEIAVQVPSTSGAASAALPGLVHVGESAATRTTRLRAGLVETESGAAGSAGPPYGLDVLISAPDRIFIRGRGLDAEMGGELRVGGTTDQIVPSGRFELIRGRLNLLGQRVDLTEGYIEPQGDLDAYMEIVAQADTGELEVQITISGEVSEPELTITSSPELPEDEVLARFLFGRDLSEISTIQALQIADAIRALNGGGPGTFGRIRGGLGLDDLDVSTTDTGETTVRAGKYLSENIYSDVARTTDGETEINLNWTLTPSLTARGTARSDDSTGIGLFLEKDY